MENNSDFDDINLDEFNFDDLSGIDEQTDVQNDVISNDAIDDIDLGNIFAENDEQITENTADNEDFSFALSSTDGQKFDDERKEPFFETVNDGDSGFISDDNIEDVNVGGEAAAEDIVLEEVSDSNESFNESIFSDSVENNFEDISKDDFVAENFEVLDDENNDYSDAVSIDKAETEFSAVDLNDAVTTEFDEAKENGWNEDGVVEEVKEDWFANEAVEDNVNNYSEEVSDNFVNEGYEQEDEASSDYFVSEGEDVDKTISEKKQGFAFDWQDDYSAVSAIEKSGNCGFLRWYSGGSADSVFEFGKDSESGNFDANEECKTLHINVGYDTYGWEVQFSDGTVMNLRDVREYQLRNGRLPNSDGRVVYGHTSLMFSGVERIVVYERIRYFSYGV